MLYVIRRDWHEWVEAFSTLAEAQIRFDQFKAESPDWNLQIVAESQEQGLTNRRRWAAQQPPTGGGKVFCISFGFCWISLDICADIYYNGVNKSTCS